jgi:adenosine deaminase
VMINSLKDFVTEMPKSDLHVHLDGSVRIDTLIELSKKQQLPLPSFTVSGLNELVFKDRYSSLSEYLDVFGLILPTMQTPENLERIAYEFAMDNINEGVCYVEVRFAPQLHINKNMNIDQVLLSVNRGMAIAKREYNSRLAIKKKKKPEFNYGIIVSALRFFSKGYSHFLDNFLVKHRHASFDKITSNASYKLAKEAVRVRDKYNIPIVALDLAGLEKGNPPIYHKQAYDFAHHNFLNLTAHAGECEMVGPENIWQAILKLNSQRVGHGLHLFAKHKITDRSIKDKNQFIAKLIEYMAKQRIGIEVCLTSNLQTNPLLKNIKTHPFVKMFKRNLSAIICTDNRTVSKTTLTKEIMFASEAFDLNRNSLRRLTANAFKKSFYPGTYHEKQEYIKHVLDCFDNIKHNC